MPTQPFSSGIDSTARGGQPLLEVRGVTKTFGGLSAVKNVSLTLKQGQIFSLIGPNGAGKTTLFNCLTGLYRSTNGNIILHHQGTSAEITRCAPDQIASLGLARTFQNIRLFVSMTALENVMVGRFLRTSAGIWSSMFPTHVHRKAEAKTAQDAYQLLDFMGLAAVANEKVSNLSYGDRRKVEVARALATDPALLLLDEPAAGMNPTETHDLMNLIEKIRQKGISILLIEHDMKVVMGISDWVLVLNYGESIAEGRPSEIQKHPKVIEAYLGEPRT